MENTKQMSVAAAAGMQRQQQRLGWLTAASAAAAAAAQQPQQLSLGVPRESDCNSAWMVCIRQATTCRHVRSRLMPERVQHPLISQCRAATQLLATCKTVDRWRHARTRRRASEANGCTCSSPDACKDSVSKLCECNRCMLSNPTP
jgi:hypothetical protein